MKEHLCPPHHIPRTDAFGGEQPGGNWTADIPVGKLSWWIDDGSLMQGPLILQVFLQWKGFLPIPDRKPRPIHIAGPVVHPLPVPARARLSDKHPTPVPHSQIA